MRILILSASTGGGHLSTSKAVAGYFINKGHDAKVVDAYEYINPVISESLSKGYLASTKYVPRVYGKFYRLAEKTDLTEKKIAMVRTVNSILSIPFSSCVKEYKPDVIICTHVMCVQVLEGMKEEDLAGIITVGIITDFTVHPYWEDTYLDYYITASELLGIQMQKKRIPASKIRAFGIPIDEKFSRKMSKSEAKKELGIQDKPTILIMSGSMGYGNVIKHIRDLDKLDMDFQMIIVCGNNKRLKRRVDELETVKTKYSYGFANNIDVMMDASECVITKPGGLSVSEGLAKGLPLMLINPIPGQEDRNLEFLLNNGLAQHITSTYPLDEAVYQLLSNEWRINNIENGIKYVGKPYATRDLCEFILSLNGENK